ncbi:hypothetical protein FD755_014376 [Muntiacus reevesi]|uniref:Mos1 transposase HTH domain-containing protein n=1 Tax=Muntiacus reevesi TaxID=9886 RepID=A0A5N3XJ73_MUNRE|nr:hypothetical protein FD755_014376 [Muntiacus reevesi]
MMLDKMQIRVIFLFKFKMSHKAEDTTRNINNAFGPGIANERTVQQWFRKFCKGNESLEDKEHHSRLLDVDKDQLRAIIKADPLSATQEAAEELNVDHSSIIRRCLISLPLIKKNNNNNNPFEVSSLILHNNEPLLNWIVTCDKKCILYNR